MENYWLISIVITISFLGESIFGFGAGLIAIPILSILIGVKEAVIFMLIFQFLTGLLIIGTYKNTPWKTVIPMCIALIIGTVIGSYVLIRFSGRYLNIFLAASIILFLIKTAYLKGFNLNKKYLKIWTYVFGFLGGLFQGIIGMGGPALTMYLMIAETQKIYFRAALIFLFFITSIIRIILLRNSTLFESKNLNMVIPVLPFYFIAIFTGHRIHTKIGEKYYKSAIYIILAFSAIVLLVKK